MRAIGKAIAVFQHEASGHIDDLLNLGENIVGNMVGESVRPIFMDLDFKNRTVLHLITQNGFAPLMSDNKVASLLDELWVGRESY